MSDDYVNRTNKTLIALGHNDVTIKDNLREVLDSLDWVELVMGLEEEFEEEIADEIAMAIWENSETLTCVDLASSLRNYIEDEVIPVKKVVPREHIEISFKVEPDMTPKEKQTSLVSILDNLSKLQGAIDRADNKQAKRIQDRDRAVTKINKMLPKGWSLVNNQPPTFDPNEIEEGSTWECIRDTSMPVRDCTVGGHYVMHCHSQEKYYFNDDKGRVVVCGRMPIVLSFKRVK